ncbi:MAG: HD domain-containing protein [Deltaproteobacteria bacterium]|nr:HD domain-containing protein [Deltaproteobacteria bacterium]
MDNYISISKRYLMKMFGEITFDLFVLPSGRKQLKEPVLLVRRNTMLTNLKETVAASGFENFYIKKSDLQNLYHHIENCIGMVIDDPLIPLREKSQIIYSCAANVMKEVFADPRSGESLSRVQKVTRNIIRFALADRSTIPSLLQLSSHDYYTFTHCLNVAVFSIGLWNTINPTDKPETLQDFALGCILHDIGKSRIDDAILNKPGRLTAEEFATIKKHPIFGYELMADSVSETTLDIILHHHEKHDGKGYPEGLRGDRISDTAKIATIADVYDALTTNRSYAEARAPFNAFLTMKEEMVGHFEQEKFISFIQLLGGKRG